MSDVHPFLERFAMLLEEPRLRDASVPTRKSEEFRFFNLKPIVDVEWSLPSANLDDNAQDWVIEEAASSTTIVRNGAVQAAALDLPPGCHVGRLSTLPESAQAAVRDAIHSPIAGLQDDLFLKLNTSADNDPFCVVLERDTVVDRPLGVLYVANGDASFNAPRMVVIAAQGSKATVVEDFRNANDDDRTFTNAMTKVVVGENANIHHVRVQREGAQARHVSRVVAHVGRFARYDSVHLTLGALSSRNDVWVSHDGEDGWSRIDGLAMVDEQREADTHSVIDNTRVRCQSHQLHKCIVDGRGHAVFNGKIFVRSGAQNIDAYQLNRNLLLSPRAKVDTKPQLEIWADDVRCTHGATIGQLDDDQLFYLQSRGMTPDAALATLTYAFAAEVINSIEVPSLARELEETAHERTMARGQA